MAAPFTARQRLRSAVAGMATLSALSSCVVGPNHEAPRISLTAFHSTAPDNQETSGVRPKLDSWWTDFHDSLLTRTIQEALAQNLDLAASVDRVEQARAAAREAGAQLCPTGQLTAQADSMHQSLTSPIGEIASLLLGYDRNATLYDVGIGASWEADLFGARHRAAQAAGADAHATEADHAAVRISIAAAVAGSYLQVRGYQSRLQLAKDQVATDESLQGDAAHAYASGSVRDGARRCLSRLATSRTRRQLPARHRSELCPPAPENATGNFVKIVQRMPVKIILDDPPDFLRSISPRDVGRGVRDNQATASLVEAHVPAERRDRWFGIACISQRPFGGRLRSGWVI